MKTYTEQFEEKQIAMSDKELIELCDKEIGTLARTYGKSHHTSIPPMITDTDMLLSQLVKRFEAITESEDQPKKIMMTSEEYYRIKKK